MQKDRIHSWEFVLFVFATYHKKVIIYNELNIIAIKLKQIKLNKTFQFALSLRPAMGEAIWV